MARSDYVYIVEYWNMSGRIILAAFTVKHELATWLYRRKYKNGLRVTRVPDGSTAGDGAKITEMDIAPLIEQGYQKAHRLWCRTLPEYRGEEPQP